MRRPWDQNTQSDVLELMPCVNKHLWICVHRHIHQLKLVADSTQNHPWLWRKLAYTLGDFIGIDVSDVWTSSGPSLSLMSSLGSSLQLLLRNTTTAEESRLDHRYKETARSPVLD